MKKSLFVRRLSRYLMREWLAPLALVFGVMAPLRSAVADWNWGPSGSMKPTIVEGIPGAIWLLDSDASSDG